MSSFEAGGYCDISEYIKDEHSRITPEELCVDEVYMLMLAVKSMSSQRQAVKQPSRIILIEQHNSILYNVRFSVLDDDMNENTQLAGKFIAEGYWKDASRIRLNQERLKSGYFKTYEDDTDAYLKELAEVCQLRG